MKKEKIQLSPATKKETSRSSRVGTVHASFEELKKALGEPHDCTKTGEWESGDKKIRVEWAFIVNNNKKLLFTIYDYKSRWPLAQIKQWSLGGKDCGVKKHLSKILLIE